MTELIRQKLIARHLAMKTVREFFEAEDFIEVDTPMLISANTPEPYIDPISVQVRISDREVITRYLHTSPELSLKRVLSYGIKRVYQLSHVFRDGELSNIHTPEFSMVEWYRAECDLQHLIKDCEKLFTRLSIALQKEEWMQQPFEQANMHDLWEKFAYIDLRAALLQIADGNGNALVEAVKKAGNDLRPGADFDDAFHHIMLKYIEPNIGQDRPCVVLRWPKQMALLSTTCDPDPLFANRFEIYARGLELANAYHELTDPIEQQRRFENDNQMRCGLGKPVMRFGQTFFSDLSRMPNSSGIALGFDRLLALFLGCRSLDQIQALNWTDDL